MCFFFMKDVIVEGAITRSKNTPLLVIFKASWHLRMELVGRSNKLEKMEKV